MASDGFRDVIYVPFRGATDSWKPQDLVDQGWRVREAATPDAVLRILTDTPGSRHAGLLDLRGGCEARDLAAFRRLLSDGRVVWVAGVAAEQLADDAVRRLIRDYCHDYVTLPCPAVMLNTIVGHAHGIAVLSPQREGDDAGPDVDGIIGDSPKMRTLYTALRKAALTDAPIFITGETGTGKELAANAIHALSTRRGRPFVAINCGAIPEKLVQSELFGYERGAFTGAQQRKLGRIEMAHNGTLFLDEIGDLPLDSQATLLRFLQEGSFERLGGHDPIRVDVRIISATHVDIEACVASGGFRADLYHRLCVLKLDQPPLRERGSDLDRIARQALRRYSGEGQRLIKGFSPCALRALHAYRWPGNVRELINRVRQAVVMADGRFITAADLHLDGESGEPPPTLEQVRNSADRDAIERALQRNRHRLIDTAAELGISRVTLYRLMLRHELRVPDRNDAEGVTHAA